MAEVVRRPGGRSAQVRRRVLEATREMMLDEGLESVTILEVAGRAGVHHTSIYRNWDDRGSLLRDALLEMVAGAAPVPDTGAVEDDLLALVDEIVAMYQTPLGQVLLDTTRSSEEALVEFRSSYWSARLDQLSAIVDRAVARGEVPADTDRTLVFELALGPVFSRALLLGSGLKDLSSREVVTVLLAGIRGGSPR